MPGLAEETAKVLACKSAIDDTTRGLLEASRVLEGILETAEAAQGKAERWIKVWSSVLGKRGRIPGPQPEAKVMDSTKTKMEVTREEKKATTASSKRNKSVASKSAKGGGRRKTQQLRSSFR